MSTINIEGIDRDKLLEALWKRAPAACYFEGISPSFSIEQAKLQLIDGYADYICGRPIKTNIYNYDEIDPSLYDRDAGDGAFMEVLNSM